MCLFGVCFGIGVKDGVEEPDPGEVNGEDINTSSQEKVRRLFPVASMAASH